MVNCSTDLMLVHMTANQSCYLPKENSYVSRAEAGVVVLPSHYSRTGTLDEQMNLQTWHMLHEC